MIDKDAFLTISELLRPESFYDPRHHKIYDAIRQLSMNEKPIDVLTVTDLGGVTHTIKASDAQQGKMVNQMARDYWFDKARAEATSIYTSSFCVIHEIDTPLNSGQSGLKW